MYKVNTDQGEEIADPAGDLDRGRVGGDGWLDLAAVRQVLGPEPHGHRHGGHEHVHDVADHPAYHKGIHMGCHGRRTASSNHRTSQVTSSILKSKLCLSVVMWSVRMEEKGRGSIYKWEVVER